MFTFFEITIKIVTFDESVNMPSPILSLKKAEKDLKSNCLKKPFVYQFSVQYIGAKSNAHNLARET